MARIIDTETKNLIGEKVKKLRKEKHMSQQQLSDRLETMAIYICRGSVSRIEDGSRTVTDIELYGLSQILATPIEDFSNNLPYMKMHETGMLLLNIPVSRLFLYSFLFLMSKADIFNLHSPLAHELCRFAACRSNSSK